MCVCAWYSPSLSMYIGIWGSFYRVCLLLRVRMWAFWDPILFVFTLSYLFESEMSDLLVGTPGHCPIHHYVHCWCDFPPCLIWVDHCSPLYYLFHHHFSFCSWFVILISPLAFFSFSLPHPFTPSLTLHVHRSYTSRY